MRLVEPHQVGLPAAHVPTLRFMHDRPLRFHETGHRVSDVSKHADAQFVSASQVTVVALSFSARRRVCFSMSMKS